MQDELRLLARAKAFEPEALAEIHDLYYGPILHYIAARVGDYQTVEDLTSEVFLRLLKALREHTAPQRTLRGWLYAVAFRVVKDHYRQHYRRREQPLDESLPAHHPPLSDVVAARISWEQVQKLLPLLTEDQQDVLALRYGTGMSVRETAEALHKSQGAVKMLQARAMATLTSLLKPEAGHE